MKIITWNVNGIRAVERKGELQVLVENERPDVLMIQEIKGFAEQFSKFLTEHPDYDQYYSSAGKAGSVQDVPYVGGRTRAIQFRFTNATAGDTVFLRSDICRGF